MGWGSAGQIFDEVAHGLIEAGASDEILGKVCYRLAKSLADQDWDTVGESVDEFRGHPVVQNALRQANGWTDFGPNDDATIEYDQGTHEWVLLVDRAEVARRTGSVDGHNILVKMWFATAPDDQDHREARERMLLR
jgi:hypothetical protein